MDGEHVYWELPDALEWLRRKGIESAHYRKEEWHHVFFERWQDHWTGKGNRPEREVVSNPDLGISFVYRCYPQSGKTQGVGGKGLREERSLHQENSQLLVRCFKFFHGQRQLGRPRKEDS